MRRQEENSTLNIDVAGEIIPKCGKAIALHEPFWMC